MSFGNNLCDAPWELWPSWASQRRVFRDELSMKTFEPKISELDDYFRDMEAAAEDWPKTKRIALLDDRTATKANGEIRLYHKPLTASQLKDQLRRRRYDCEFPFPVRDRSSIEGSKNKSRGAKELYEILSRRRFSLDDSLEPDDDMISVSDAERRIIFLTDLDPSTLETLMTTASCNQAPALKDLFYKHLTNKTSVQVNVPDQGFASFDLSIHIPYYVFKIRDDILKDTRKKTYFNPWDLNTEKCCDSQELHSTHFPMDKLWSRSGVFSGPGASQLAKGRLSNNICIDWSLHWKKRIGEHSSMKEGWPGSGLPEHIDSSCPRDLIDLLLAAFKALFSFSAGRIKTPGQCRNLTFPFLLLWATPVAADLSIERGSGFSVRPCAPKLEDEVKSLLSKTVMPWLHEVESVSSPEALLIACFLYTAFTVFIVAIRRQDRHQKYFFAVGLALSAIAGANRSVSMQDFVFGYLFVGLNISLLLSFLYHAYGAHRDGSFKESVKHGVHGDQTLKLEAGNLAEEKI